MKKNKVGKKIGNVISEILIGCSGQTFEKVKEKSHVRIFQAKVFVQPLCTRTET
jgi:hypothetical protein